MADKIEIEVTITLPDKSAFRFSYAPDEPQWQGMLCERLIFETAGSTLCALNQMRLIEDQKSIRVHLLMPVFAALRRTISDIAAEKVARS